MASRGETELLGLMQQYPLAGLTMADAGDLITAKINKAYGTNYGTTGLSPNIPGYGTGGVAPGMQAPGSTTSVGVGPNVTRSYGFDPVTGVYEIGNTGEQIAKLNTTPTNYSGIYDTLSGISNTLGKITTQITPQTIQQGVQNITPQGLTIPTTVLQPGSTDTNAVKALQDYLVKTGYMTQAQVNTGYGIYGPQTTAAVQALQQKLGVDNSTGPGYFGPRTIAALQASNMTTANTTPGGVTASGLTGTTANPINLGANTGSFSTANSLVAGASATSKSIQDYINLLTPPTDATHQKYNDLLAQVEGMLPSVGGRGEAQLSAEQANNVPGLKQSLADINAQILSKTAQYKALSTDVEGKPITMNSIIGAQAQIQKAMASDIGLLQATAQGLQGQLTAAQETANRSVDLKYQDAQDAINIRLQQLQLIAGELDKTDKIRADAINLYLQDKKDQLAITIANEKDKNATLLNLINTYPDAKIQLTDTLEQAAAKVSSSKIYQEKIRPPVSATPSGTMTNVQLEQSINKKLADPAFLAASLEDQQRYIRSLGGNPADFGY